MMCLFWSFYTSWWFVAIDFDSCGLCRSKTGTVLSHRLHQAIACFRTRENRKKSPLCSTGFPCSLSHSATACDVLDCATYVRDLFQRVVIDAMTKRPLTVVYWVCIKSRPPFENMCWVATNDQCLLSTYLWSISMLFRAPFLYTLAHTSIMAGELTLR